MATSFEVLQEAILKADILVEALGWVRAFRDKVVVIKIGGSVMEDWEAMDGLLKDIIFMESIGLRPVLVHGGGKAISRAMDEAGLEPCFIDGYRYTNAQTLEIVQRILNALNERIVDHIEKLGGFAHSLNSKSTLVVLGSRTQKELGFVGDVYGIKEVPLQRLCAMNVIPVIPSLCLDGKQVLNVNADVAALEVARYLSAEKLVFLSDVQGVYRDSSDPDSLIPSLTTSEAREMIQDGLVSKGMIPKLTSCIEVLESGVVSKTHIIDGRVSHALLLEIYTDQGVGTELVRG